MLFSTALAAAVLAFSVQSFSLHRKSQLCLPFALLATCVPAAPVPAGALLAIAVPENSNRACRCCAAGAMLAPVFLANAVPVPKPIVIVCPSPAAAVHDCWRCRSGQSAAASGRARPSSPRRSQRGQKRAATRQRMRGWRRRRPRRTLRSLTTRARRLTSGHR